MNRWPASKPASLAIYVIAIVKKNNRYKEKLLKNFEFIFYGKSLTVWVMMRGTIDMKISLFRHVIIIPGARLIWKGFYDPLYLRYTFGE